VSFFTFLKSFPEPLLPVFWKTTKLLPLKGQILFVWLRTYRDWNQNHATSRNSSLKVKKHLAKKKGSAAYSNTVTLCQSEKKNEQKSQEITRSAAHKPMSEHEVVNGLWSTKTVVAICCAPCFSSDLLNKEGLGTTLQLCSTFPASVAEPELFIMVSVPVPTFYKSRFRFRYR